ncbi:TPA: glycosyltransferase family 2 protein [Vibrio alginolyticus]|nr:glycosyltransferase family 2 protein [Vibrio alginolyticus]EHA1120924.1 glycosyltransferase family 2 protein [Vibrio alginolyticus]HCZ9258681.1 glycosyltransferase family 2 protein [Vibrio alginolyticus]HCZ9295712.1 glycosyltransferase family 2 protein [Vibrio alginolyticus]
MFKIWLSVIIPAYNVEDYIEECLDSILNQNIEGVEVIIVDDGSKDETLSKAKRYERSNVKVVSQLNAGQSSARNRGLKLAAGKYIWFVDSDDVVSSNSIEKLREWVKEKPEIIAFNGDTIIDSNNSSGRFCSLNYIRPKFELSVDQKTFFSRSVKENKYFVQPCHYVFLREISEKINFKEGVVYEDNLFTTELFLKGDRQILIKDEYLYKRRIRDGSTMTSAVTQQKVDSFKFIVEELVRDRNEYSKYINLSAYDRFLVTMIDSYLVSLLRFESSSLIKRVVFFINMLKFNKDIFNKKTIILAFSPDFIYKIYKSVNDHEK